MSSKKIPLVFTCSFDSEFHAWLFDTEEEAKAELKRQFDEEVRIQTEKNGHKLGNDIEVKFSDENASITIFYDDEKDVMKWSIDKDCQSCVWWRLGASEASKTKD